MTLDTSLRKRQRAREFSIRAASLTDAALSDWLRTARGKAEWVELSPYLDGPTTSRIVDMMMAAFNAAGIDPFDIIMGRSGAANVRHDDGSPEP